MYIIGGEGRREGGGPRPPAAGPCAWTGSSLSGSAPVYIIYNIYICTHTHTQAHTHTHTHTHRREAHRERGRRHVGGQVRKARARQLALVHAWERVEHGGVARVVHHDQPHSARLLRVVHLDGQGAGSVTEVSPSYTYMYISIYMV